MVSKILLLAMLPIGDSLFAEPTVRALRSRYPQAEVVAYTRSSAAPVWRCMSALSDVRVLPTGSDWAGIGPLARSVLQTRARGFDVAIDFTSPAYKWISLLAGIPMRTYMKFDRLWWL